MSFELSCDAIGFQIEDGDSALSSTGGEQVTAPGEANTYCLPTTAQACGEGFGDVLGEENGVGEGEVPTQITLQSPEHT